MSGEALARRVLERVCAGADPRAAEGVYSRDFHDHVNARDYRGHEGIAKSLAGYQLAFRDGDLRIRVEEQITEGDRVCSRWVAEGHNRGRPLRLWGITIRRIAYGEIVEDWSATDNSELVRQLGLGRKLLLALDRRRSRRRARTPQAVTPVGTRP